MALPLGACEKKEKVVIEDMETEEVNSLTFDFLGGKDVMPISGYYGPYAGFYSINGQTFPDYMTDEIFAKLSECGLNLIHHSASNYRDHKDTIIKSLELGEKHNIGMFVVDPLICQPWNKEIVVEEAVKEWDKQIKEYCDYPAFSGMYVVDEPGTPYWWQTANQHRDVSAFVPVFETLNQLGIVGGGNLSAPLTEADYEAWNRYIEEYCSTCNPKYLSYDYYIWYSGRNKEVYFYSIDTIRSYAEKYEIPFWCYIQTGGDYNDGMAKFDTKEYYPNEGQMTWNVNTCLAYGTKGIEYFMAIQPHYFAFAASKPFDFQRNGLLGAWGNKTQWWYYAQKINEQIAAVDHVLMNSVNKGVIVSGESAIKDTQGLKHIMPGDSWRELESVEGSALIGCFNYQGKTALYVVNYEESYAQKIKLNLHDAYDMSITHNAETTRVNTEELVLDLKAGEGALVVFD
jgi:hypothetical protein